VVQAVYPEITHDGDETVDVKRAVIGLAADQSFERAPCCRPLPGERIVGVTFRGRGVVIHAIDCDRMAAYEDQPNRWVDVGWQAGTHAAVYPVALDVTVGNGPGVLGRICTLIGEAGANISDMRFMDRKPDFYRLLIDVDLRDFAQLHSLMLALEADNDVAQVVRHREKEAQNPVQYLA